MSSKKPTPDRRIVRTRGALQEALIGLILEKGYDAITVNDIIGRANVARSTFYAHHGGKESVLLEGIGALREFLSKAQREARGGSNARAPLLAFSLAMFEHADGHRDLYQALMRDRGGAAAMNAIRQMLARLIHREMNEASAAGKKAGSVPVEAVIRFTTDAFLSVMTWWIDAKPRMTPADGDRIFRQLIEPALAANGFSASQRAIGQ
jgi:AcrR family transcriptional regulator